MLSYIVPVLPSMPNFHVKEKKNKQFSRGGNFAHQKMMTTNSNSNKISQCLLLDFFASFAQSSWSLKIILLFYIPFFHDSTELGLAYISVENEQNFLHLSLLHFFCCYIVLALVYILDDATRASRVS